MPVITSYSIHYTKLYDFSYFSFPLVRGNPEQMFTARDQIVHDVALQNLPVVFAIDRAGLVGSDGPTHHGSFDISFLRHIPNLTIMARNNFV